MGTSRHPDKIRNDQLNKVGITMNDQKSKTIILLAVGIIIGAAGFALAGGTGAHNPNQIGKTKIAVKQGSDRAIGETRPVPREALERGSLLGQSSGKDGQAAKSASDNSATGGDKEASAPSEPAEQPAAKAEDHKNSSHEWLRPGQAQSNTPPNSQNSIQPPQQAVTSGEAGEVVTRVTHYVIQQPSIVTTTHYSIPATAPVGTSGYELPPGGTGRAVDHPDSGAGPWHVGKNGMLQNPCVDPPSTMGRAYNRGTAY